MEIDTDFIKTQLERRRDERQLHLVAKGACVSKRTLTYILAGRCGRAETLSGIQKYLKLTMRRKNLAKETA